MLEVGRRKRGENEGEKRGKGCGKKGESEENSMRSWNVGSDGRERYNDGVEGGDCRGVVIVLRAQ